MTLTDGFAGGEDDPALAEVLARNELADGYARTLPSKLTQGCAFAAVNLGADGHAHVRQLCDEAARTMFHMQVLGNFYMMPRLALMGLTDDQFEAIVSSKMRTYIDAVLATTRDQATGQVPQLQQLNGASPQPFIDVIQLLAKQFSAETAVPLNSLGVVTDNPSSAEAIEASREDICDVAERDIGSDKASLARVVRLALAVERDLTTDELPAGELAVAPRFMPANMASLAARADAAAKYAGIRTGFGETDVCAEMLGFDEAERARITAQTRLAAGLDLMSDMMGGGNGEGAS